MIEEDSRRRQEKPEVKGIMETYHISPEEEELFYALYAREHIYRTAIWILAIVAGVLATLLLLTR